MDNQNLQMNVSLEDTMEIKFEKCEHTVFNQSFLLRGVSRFITGGTQDSIVPVAVFSCNSCGHVNDMFIPKLPEKTEDNTSKISPFTIIK